MVDLLGEDCSLVVLVTGSRYMVSDLALGYVTGVLVRGIKKNFGMAYMDRPARKHVTILHGSGRGCDALASRASQLLGMRERGMAADWDNLGLLAGPKRNGEMVALLSAARLQSLDTMAIAFWDGKVKRSGTLDCCAQLNRADFPVEVVPAVL